MTREDAILNMERYYHMRHMMVENGHLSVNAFMTELMTFLEDRIGMIPPRTRLEPLGIEDNAWETKPSKRMVDKGYLGIQMLNGYSHTIPESRPKLKALVEAVDKSIDKGECANLVEVTNKFYEALTKELGQDLFVLDTLVGKMNVIRNVHIKSDVRVSINDTFGYTVETL
jgi:hypothetical protein